MIVHFNQNGEVWRAAISSLDQIPGKGEASSSEGAGVPVKVTRSLHDFPYEIEWRYGRTSLAREATEGLHSIENVMFHMPVIDALAGLTRALRHAVALQEILGGGLLATDKCLVVGEVIHFVEPNRSVVAFEALAQMRLGSPFEDFDKIVERCAAPAWFESPARWLWCVRKDGVVVSHSPIGRTVGMPTLPDEPLSRTQKVPDILDLCTTCRTYHPERVGCP